MRPGIQTYNLPKTATDDEIITAVEGAVPSGSLTGLSVSGAPVDGVTAVHLLTVSGSPTGGDVAFSKDGGVASSAVTYAILTGTAGTAEAAVKAALESLAEIGTGNIASVVRSGSTPNFVFTVTYGGSLAGKPLGLVTVTNGLTGGSNATMTPTSSVTGVSGTHRAVAGIGAMLHRTDAGYGNLYVNNGSYYVPVWKLVTRAS